MYLECPKCEYKGPMQVKVEIWANICSNSKNNGFNISIDKDYCISMENSSDKVLTKCSNLNCETISTLSEFAKEGNL